MRTKLLWLSLSLSLLAMVVPFGCRNNTRSVRPSVNTASLATLPSHFDPGQSAGFFCGNRLFPRNRELTQVQFAADDAVDLAYTLAMENNDLLRPSRVTIALSGNPSKGDSKERLRLLKAAGARVVMVDAAEDIRQLLHEQAALAGRGGLFIASFATHGFHSDGIPYLLAPDSKFLDVETSIPVPEIAEIAGSSAARSLVLLDACRERVSRVTRAGSREPRAAATLLELMAKIEGQVIFSAAPPGGYAYDDPERGNGVFTAAIIDSLQCEGTNRAMVNVDSLAKSVERKVLHFLKKRDPSAKKATQLSTEGSTRLMPLAQCRTVPPPIVPIERVVSRGSNFIAFNANGDAVWEKTLDGEIRDTYVGPLFREKTNYVVVLSDDGSDAARVSIYDSAGNLFGDYPHNGPVLHMEVHKPTASHNPRIFLAGMRRNLATQLGLTGSVPTVQRLWAEKPGPLTEEWCVPIGRPRETVTKFGITGKGKTGAIVVSTSAGKTIRLDFKGNVLP